MPEAATSPFPAAFHESGGFRLEVRPAGHILQALSRGFRADLSARLAAIAEPAPFAVRRAGPDTWFIVGEAELSAAELGRRGAELADVAWLVDQTHGRCRLIASGPDSARRLAGGIGADLSPRSFSVGAATESQYGGIGLHLARTAPDCFEILVGRSFAASLWGELASFPQCADSGSSGM
jgi:sarcosine oxidase subunit gamma